MRKYMFIPLAAIVILGTFALVGCNTASQNQVSPSKLNSGNSVAKTDIMIYYNPNYLAQSNGSNYTSYFAGEVYSETSAHMSQMEAGGHSPWKADPIYVAVSGTGNFAPKGEVTQVSDSAKEFIGTYQGRRVTYRLVSTTEQTATVVERGLPYGLTIKLFKPMHHRYWLIYRVDLN